MSTRDRSIKVMLLAFNQKNPERYRAIPLPPNIIKKIKNHPSEIPEIVLKKNKMPDEKLENKIKEMMNDPEKWRFSTNHHFKQERIILKKDPKIFMESNWSENGIILHGEDWSQTLIGQSYADAFKNITEAICQREENERKKIMYKDLGINQ